MENTEESLLDNFSQENFEPVEYKELSFDKKTETLSAQYEEFLSMEQRGIILEGENVDDTFLPRRRRELEEEYISLVCEASPEEFQEWRFATLERIIFGLMQELDKEDPEEKQEEKEEEEEGEKKKIVFKRDLFRVQRLFSIFQLYMVAKATRNEN